MLVIVAVLIGALLTTSALALRTPTTSANTIKSDLASRIGASRAHADVQTRLIATLRREIDTAQAATLSQQSQSALTTELSRLELATGTVPVTGPGLVLTVDDAATPVDPANPGVDPGTSGATDKGKVIDLDLQMIVNGLWEAGAEAISINGHRLTSRAAIRSAGAAILVDFRPLTRPYVITAIGDPRSLSVEFADNDGGSWLQSLKANYRIRGGVLSRDSVAIPGEPALSLQVAQPVQSAVTRQAPATATVRPSPAPTTTTTTQRTTETPR